MYFVIALEVFSMMMTRSVAGQPRQAMLVKEGWCHFHPKVLSKLLVCIFLIVGLVRTWLEYFKGTFSVMHLERRRRLIDKLEGGFLFKSRGRVSSVL